MVGLVCCALFSPNAGSDPEHARAAAAAVTKSAPAPAPKKPESDLDRQMMMEEAGQEFSSVSSASDNTDPDRAAPEGTPTPDESAADPAPAVKAVQVDSPIRLTPC